MPPKIRRKSIGWLLFGLGCGIFLGVAIPLHLLVPAGYVAEYSRSFATSILVGAALGIGMGIFLDAQIERNPGVFEWAMLGLIVATWIALALPMLNAARE